MMEPAVCRIGAAVVALLAGWVSVASAQPPAGAAEIPVDAVDIRGVTRTRPATVTSLLPRDPPAAFAASEIEELERRLNNLGIFDAVAVRIEGRRLIVELREKWTLIPDADLATGRTFADTYVSLGATEFNLLGTAASLGAAASWEERGPNGVITFSEHEYNARAGAFAAEAGYESVSFRFASSDGWYRDRAGGWIGWQPPYRHGAPLRVRIIPFGFHERSSRLQGITAPPAGVTLGGAIEVVRNRYTWRDLDPSGYRITLDMAVGRFVPAGQGRYEAAIRVLGAVSPTATTALVARAVGQILNAGNVNHSLLLSSQVGVRGLADAFYRNQAQAYVNLELRQAWRFAERWALQGALFADAAVFASMDAAGVRQPAERALATGGGLRLVPTWLAEIVLRVDGGRLFAPEARWFVQLGLTQYF
jgi:hypothetical protein